MHLKMCKLVSFTGEDANFTDFISWVLFLCADFLNQIWKFPFISENNYHLGKCPHVTLFFISTCKYSIRMWNRDFHIRKRYIFTCQVFVKKKKNVNHCSENIYKTSPPACLSKLWNSGLFRTYRFSALFSKIPQNLTKGLFLPSPTISTIHTDCFFTLT